MQIGRIRGQAYIYIVKKWREDGGGKRWKAREENRREAVENRREAGSGGKRGKKIGGRWEADVGWLSDLTTSCGLRSIPGRNSSKQNTTRKRYTDLGDSGGLNRRKLYIETKSQEETGTKTSSGVFSHLGGAARGGPAPPVCETHTNSFSCPFSSRDFSYLLKIAKILKEELFAKFF
jgi:hypothetical protein